MNEWLGIIEFVRLQNYLLKIFDDLKIVILFQASIVFALVIHMLRIFTLFIWVVPTITNLQWSNIEVHFVEGFYTSSKCFDLILIVVNHFSHSVFEP